MFPHNIPQCNNNRIDIDIRLIFGAIISVRGVHGILALLSAGFFISLSHSLVHTCFFFRSVFFPFVRSILISLWLLCTLAIYQYITLKAKHCVCVSVARFFHLFDFVFVVHSVRKCFGIKRWTKMGLSFVRFTYCCCCCCFALSINSCQWKTSIHW